MQIGGCAPTKDRIAWGTLHTPSPTDRQGQSACAVAHRTLLSNIKMVHGTGLVIMESCLPEMRPVARGIRWM